MTAIGDGEDNPPLERHSYPGFSGPDEITQTDLKSPIPQRRDTQPVTLSDLMAYLGRLDGKLDELSARVGAIDTGLIGYNDELTALRSDMRQGFEGVRLWLFGEDADRRTIRTGIAHHVAAASELGKSALDRAAAAGDTAERALTVAHEALSLAQQPHAGNGAAE